MMKVRSKKPQWWDDKKLHTKCTLLAASLHDGLFTRMANDHGKFLAGSDDLKAHLFRYRKDVTEEAVEEALMELYEHGFIELYEDRDGLQRYGRFRPDKWAKHQHVTRPARDELPEPGRSFPMIVPHDRSPDEDIKRATRQAVNAAIGKGELERGSCEVCGSTDRVQGHHDDYSRPLDVRWLCSGHHALWHKENVAVISRENMQSAGSVHASYIPDRNGEERNPPISPDPDPVDQAATMLATALAQDEEYWKDTLKVHHSANRHMDPAAYVDAAIDYLHRLETGKLKRRPGSEARYLLKSVKDFHADVVAGTKRREAREKAFEPAAPFSYPQLPVDGAA